MTLSDDTAARLVAVLERLEKRLASNDAPVMTIAEACAAIGCKRRKLFDLIASGSLCKVKHGRATCVTADSVYALIGLPTHARR